MVAAAVAGKYGNGSGNGSGNDDSVKVRELGNGVVGEKDSMAFLVIKAKYNAFPLSVLLDSFASYLLSQTRVNSCVREFLVKLFR